MSRLPGELALEFLANAFEATALEDFNYRQAGQILLRLVLSRRVRQRSNPENCQPLILCGSGNRYAVVGTYFSLFE